jgi:TatD DNase family protein
MYDIGLNLCSTQFEHDWKDVLLNAEKKGMTGAILTSTSVKSFYKNLELIKHNPTNISLHTTIGFHPHNSNVDKKSFEELFLLYEKHKEHIVSVGETGLDYFRHLVEEKKQKETFLWHLDYSQEHNLSLFLHEREAFNDFYDILSYSKNEQKKVVHCFTGKKEELKKYLDIDCYIGITTWLCDHRRNHDIKEAIQYLPLDRMLIETDAPYLIPKIPELKSVKRNEPQFLHFLIDALSKYLKLDRDFIIEKTTENTQNFFHITPKINDDLILDKKINHSNI